jgi:4-hydroxybenzoate polyprenyltransferase
MFQMSASPHYQGFLAIHHPWAIAILVKHALFFGMAGVSAYLTWGVLPALRRVALLGAKASPEQKQSLQRREQRLLHLNLILGILVLALTALARVT